MKVIDVSHPLGKRPSPDTNWFINVLYVLSVLHLGLLLYFFSGSNVSKTMTIRCRNIYSRMFQSKNLRNPNISAFWWPFFVYHNRKSSRKFRKSLQSSERCRCHEEYSWVEKTKQSFYILARKVVGKCKQLLNHISCLISYSLCIKVPGVLMHSALKSIKMSHYVTKRAKRAVFTFWMNKS